MNCQSPARCSLLAVALALACLPVSARAADGPVKVKLATLAPKGTSFHQSLLGMGEQWRKAPAGGVALTVYPDGTMGGESDMVRRMRVGQIHAAMLTATGLGEIDPSVFALQVLPMMFRTLDEFDYVRRKLQPMMERRFEEKGFVVLFWVDAGWVHFFSKDAGITPDDFRRMKIFVWAGQTHQIDLIKSLGYNGVPLEPTDILTSLQTGLINAVACPPVYALAGQFYAPAPHMLDLNWVPLVGGTVITRKTWDAIPESTRADIRKAAEEAGRQIQARSRAEADESVEAMKKRGLTVHPVTPEAEAQWKKLAEEVYPKIRGKVVPVDIFDEVLRLLREYRAAGGKNPA